MVTFKDLFHYVYDRNACFHFSIPTEFAPPLLVHVHKMRDTIFDDGFESTTKKIVIDEFDVARYTITLFDDDTVQLVEFTNPNGHTMKLPVFSEYFPLDIGITYDQWKEYDGEKFTLLLVTICKRLDEIIAKWIEEDTNGGN